MSTVQPYTYSALNNETDFRLLILEPGTEPSPLRCTLAQFAFTDCPEYEAISYVWGSGPGREVLLCSEKLLEITPNLHSALQQLRYADKQRFLWAHAICIYQDDLSERSQQVMIMGEIYAAACCTLVWLGPQRDDDCDAFEVMQWLFTTMEIFFEYGDLIGVDASFWDLIPSRLAAVSPDIDQSKLKHLGHLLTRSWFHRVWIIQEVAKAKQVSILYGHQVISFEAFQIAWYIPSVQRTTVLATLSNLSMLHICRLQVAADEIDLFNTTCFAQQLKSRDPRDQLYALHGTAGEAETFKVRPDYSGNLRELLMEVAIADFVERRHIRFLSCASIMTSASNPNCLPSWVPDLSTERRSLPLLLALKPSVRAAGSSLPVLSVNSSTDVLTVEGKMLAHISKLTTSNVDDSLDMDDSTTSVVGGSSQVARHDFRVLQYLAEATMRWLQECHFVSLGHFRITSELYESIRYEYFARAVIFSPVPGDELRLQNVERFKHVLRTLQENLDNLKLWGQESFELDSAEEEDVNSMVSKGAQVDEFLLSCSRHAQGRRFCGTDTGHLGWVPVGNEEGDCVCLIFGGDVLYVLRPDGNDHYRLIGECYLEGVMNGEGLNMPGNHTREFRIR